MSISDIDKLMGCESQKFGDEHVYVIGIAKIDLGDNVNTSPYYSETSVV